ncbi:MAG TPA: hypothetical protein VIM08_08770, partial [Arthrobacter sp.]
MLNTDDGQAQGPDGQAAPEAPEEQTAPAAKSSRKKRTLLATAAVVLLAGGVAFGTVLPDPKTSEAYKALADEKGRVEIERDAALSSYASVKGKYDSLQGGITARESKVSARETEVG